VACELQTKNLSRCRICLACGGPLVPAASQPDSQDPPDAFSVLCSVCSTPHEIVLTIDPQTQKIVDGVVRQVAEVSAQATTERREALERLGRLNAQLIAKELERKKIVSDYNERIAELKAEIAALVERLQKRQV